MDSGIGIGIALRTCNASDRIALRGVRVHACLAGMSQRTTVEQTFVNLEPRAIEAVYTFPLPEGAAVCAFEVITGDRVLTGVVEESDKAIEQYDDAVADGHGAFLMEQERPDVFTVRVGNLKPRQAATIRLTYVCALDRVDREIRVAFPTTVAPRYVTATATDPLEAAIDGDALNPPHALWVPYGLAMTVDIELGRELTDVYSPSHSIHVSHGADGASSKRTTVTLAGGVTEMNRDVVLRLRLKKEHEPSVQVERRVGPAGEDEKYLAVTFVPEFDESELAEPAPVETVFVLDCSGSMQGQSIAQATLALELCLRSLSGGDTFNLCRFGSRFELMSSEPLAYSQATLDRALKYVQQGGDLGGTELYAPLEAIFMVPPRAGHVRQVILLTDGQVSNEPAVIALARKHRARNRIFTFGIGAASSAFLVKGIARATGGAAEFIAAGERIDEKVLRTFSRLASPVVNDVSIDWDGCDVQTLAELPPVFDGDAMTVFGRAPARLPKQVTLSCRTPAGPRNWTVPVVHAEDLGGVIPLMWARRTIQSMEEVNDVPRGRAAKRSREQEMLVSISKQFGLVCSLTSFIAVEHRSLEERNEGKPALRRVSTQLAAGWGDLLGEVAGGAYGGMMAAAAAAAPRRRAGAAILAGLVDRTMDRTIDRMRCAKDKSIDARPAAPPAAPRQQSFFDADGFDRTLDKSLDRSVDSGCDVDALVDGLPASGHHDPVQAPIVKLIHQILAEAARQGAKLVQVFQMSDHVSVHFTISGHDVERDRIPLKMRRPLFKNLRELASPAGVVRLELDNRTVVEWHLREHRTAHGDAMTLTSDAITSAAERARSLQEVLMRQSADGWFEWDEHVVGLGPKRQQLEAAIDRWLGGLPELNVISTVATLTQLRSHHRENEDLWRRAERKALRWLADAVQRPQGDVGAWLDTLARDPQLALGSHA